MSKYGFYYKLVLFKIVKIFYYYNMLKNLNKLSVKVTQNKFYIISILLILFVSFQLAGLNDRLDVLIEVLSEERS